jgi:hypothetical protein
MSHDPLSCKVASRADRIRSGRGSNGIDYLEVADDQRSLLVYFFAGAPPVLTPDQVRIDGGRRIRGIVATAITPGPTDEERGADCVRIALNRYGDFSTYTLRLVGDDGESPPPGIDPRYAQIDFSFKVDCPGDADCASMPDCATPARAAPDIDYAVKDYTGFRRLLLDRLAVTTPQWRERHVPDIGITLVELLAHAADQLSVYQDAVATEAYLDTARRRVSVRRHARLVDYRLHEGCNARAWLALACDADTALPVDAYFVTANDAFDDLAHGRTLRDHALARVTAAGYAVFEQAGTRQMPFELVARFSEIPFYTWGDSECCLAQGATRATLRDPGAANDARRLSAGDVLIVEEILGPKTGHPGDADPEHRQALRLTSVEYTRDPLCDTAIIEIEWDPGDALRFTLCLSARLAAPDCRRIDGISVARGNVILVDHGRRVRNESLGCVDTRAEPLPCGCDGTVPERVVAAAPFAASLREAPLLHAEPVPRSGAASAALIQDPRRALPLLAIGEGEGDVRWEARSDLLDSDGDTRHVAVETDDDGRAHLRFGDGRCGRAPTAGACYRADYRIGDPRAGNVPREAIAFVVFRDSVVDAGLVPRNPLPAQGGTPAEDVAAAKRAAPQAFRGVLARAITAEDYAQIAQGDAAVQRANARLIWTGSGYHVDVAIDPYGSEEATPELCARIARRLACVRRIGHDVHVRPARYVPIELVLSLCIEPGRLRGEVKAAVRAGLVGRRGDGARALFHPDALTFGSDLFEADVIAAVQAVSGVQSVDVVSLRRVDGVPVRSGLQFVDLASFEIAQLDDDPDFPERGILKFLHIGGGR